MSEKLPTIPERTPLRVAFTFVGGLLAFLIFGVTIWLIVRSYANSPTVDDQRAKTRLDYKAKADSEARRLLETYGWIDKDKGIAHVPITEAMKRIVEDYEFKQVGASSVPVPGTAAAEAAAAALLGGSSTDSNTKTDGNAQPDNTAATAPSATDVNPEALIPDNSSQSNDSAADPNAAPAPASEADANANPEPTQP